jgi:predicted 3-demethylubiquinone-9 3-methyltransferase (glyoxalase superfamily)
MQRISPCLWFDNQAEEAVNFYLSIFKNSRIKTITRFSAAGPGPEGAVMVVSFELDGVEFVALNGGPVFQFNEAVSLAISCGTQAEVDHYWNKLSAGGSEGQCGWLKDKYGVSWQVVPIQLTELIGSSDGPRVKRMTEAMFKMKKLDIATLVGAFNA